MRIRELFGSNIKRLREKLGMSQKDLSEKLRIAQNQLSAVENGKTGFTAESVEKYCAALNCEPSELFYVEHNQSDISQNGSTQHFDPILAWGEFQVKMTEKIVENRELKKRLDEITELMAGFDAALWRKMKETAPPEFFLIAPGLDKVDYMFFLDAFAQRVEEAIKSLRDAGAPSKDLDSATRKGD